MSIFHSCSSRSFAHTVFRDSCIAGALVALSLTSIICFSYIGPCIREADRILENTHQLHKNPPTPLKKLIALSHKNHSIMAFGIKCIRLKLEHDKQGILFWHLTGLPTALCMDALYSTDEFITLWLDCAHYEKGHGLNNAARYYYGQTLEQLGIQELALLVTIARCPSCYKNDRDKTALRARELATKYNETRSIN